MRVYIAPLAVLAGLSSAVVARPIDLSSFMDRPGFPGDGLGAEIWGWGGPSLDECDDVIGSRPADSVFHASVVDYPGGDSDIVSVSDPLSTFLGADAASLAGTFGPDTPSSGLIFRFSGYLAIDQPGEHTIGVASDDGMRLRLQGVDVVAWDSDRSFSDSSELVNFMNAGLYRLDMVYWANADGESGVELSMDGAIIPQDSLYTVPAPGAMTIALSCLGLVVRRRR